MSNPKNNLCESIRQEATAMIEMGAVLNMGAIGYADAVEVIEASVEKLNWIRDQLKKLQVPTSKK